MSIPIPVGYLIQKIEFIPPEVKIASSNQSRFVWLHERLLDMKVNNGSLMLTVPDVKIAKAIYANITAFSKRNGDKLTPPRVYKAYTSPADNKENGLYHVFVECRAK
ncbi:MAG: hypothetical protein H6636_06845 [Anaerolineales bacterium]|nr:hypothetical protein [Anaerolineales bacterium]